MCKNRNSSAISVTCPLYWFGVRLRLFGAASGQRMVPCKQKNNWLGRANYRFVPVKLKHFSLSYTCFEISIFFFFFFFFVIQMKYFFVANGFDDFKGINRVNALPVLQNMLRSGKPLILIQDEAKHDLVRESPILYWSRLSKHSPNLQPAKKRGM